MMENEKAMNKVELDDFKSIAWKIEDVLAVCDSRDFGIVMTKAAAYLEEMYHRILSLNNHDFDTEDDSEHFDTMCELTSSGFRLRQRLKNISTQLSGMDELCRELRDSAALARKIIAREEGRCGR